MTSAERSEQRTEPIVTRSGACAGGGGGEVVRVRVGVGEGERVGDVVVRVGDGLPLVRVGLSDGLGDVVAD
nr:hypothetical protein GCM10010200_059950 [Actinomadura rugatobispora]